MKWLIYGAGGMAAAIWLYRFLGKAITNAVTVERQKDIIKGNLQAEQDEDEIEEAAAKARRDALPDFTTLR